MYMQRRRPQVLSSLMLPLLLLLLLLLCMLDLCACIGVLCNERCLFLLLVLLLLAAAAYKDAAIASANIEHEGISVEVELVAALGDSLSDVTGSINAPQLQEPRVVLDRLADQSC